ERRGDRLVVRAILLARAARDGNRDRTLDVDPSQHRADEARDPAIAREARLVLVPPLPEEAARLEQEAVEQLRVAPVRVQHGERSEARPHPDPYAVRHAFRDRGDELAGERA